MIQMSKKEIKNLYRLALSQIYPSDALSLLIVIPQDSFHSWLQGIIFLL